MLLLIFAIVFLGAAAFALGEAATYPARLKARSVRLAADYGRVRVPDRSDENLRFRELIGRDANSEIALGMAFLVCRVDEEHLDSGQRLERLIEHGGAAPLGEHELAAGPRKRPGDAVCREMGFDG